MERLRAVRLFELYLCLPGSDVSDRVVPILLVSPERRAVFEVFLLGVTGKTKVAKHQ